MFSITLSFVIKKGVPSYSQDTAASNLPESSANEIKVELQEGPLRAEIINDQVSLDIETPTVIVSSQGKNTFGVAYDPQTGKSFVAAYQYPIQVQPTGGSQAPFTLESGQEVEISNGQVRQATPSGQTPTEEKVRNPGFVPEGSQGGCYADPLTGEINLHRLQWRAFRCRERAKEWVLSRSLYRPICLHRFLRRV